MDNTPPNQPQNPNYPQNPQYPQYPQYPPNQAPMPGYGQQPPANGNGVVARMNAFRRQRPVLAGIAALIALCVVCAACAGIVQGISGGSNAAGSSNQAASSSTNATAAPTATRGPTATPTPSYAHFDDGTFQVGKDVQPGTYRTRAGSSGCYYARLKGFGGTVDDIIANNNTDAPAVITISASDKGFESQNCGTWTKDLSQITTSKTTFDDGIFIVGTDITPGTYKNTGGQNCYYARLSGFGGSLDEIIANNNIDTSTIVTISASDKGFESNGCGTWTKQ